MKPAKEPKTWVTIIKLLAIATALIGGVGLALWLASQGSGGSPALQQAIEAARAAGHTEKPSNSWGIVTDSPLRPAR
jgi:hypothetical protein